MKSRSDWVKIMGALVGHQKHFGFCPEMGSHGRALNREGGWSALSVAETLLAASEENTGGKLEARSPGRSLV